jgi:hypothetical protein
MLLPIFDFDDITSLEKFEHKCIDNLSKHFNETMEDYNVYYSSKLQELLSSFINSRISSEKIVLETIIIPEVIIQNPLCFFILEIIENIFDINFIPKWIFKLLKFGKFINLGEINCQHWVYQAYNSEKV